MTPSCDHAIAPAGEASREPSRARGAGIGGTRRAGIRVMAALLAGLPWVFASTGARAQDPFNPQCPLRFELYENATRNVGAMDNQRRMSTSPQVQAAARWLRMGNCLTFSDQLAPMATLAPGAGLAARTNAGPTIPPTYLHAGIVTSSADEARTIDFFASQGLRARGLGAAYLGRRIYVGPFVTAGALEGGMALARDAGFAYPYPGNF